MSKEGVYWLTRIQSQCFVYDDSDNEWDLAEYLSAQKVDVIESDILLGKKGRLPCRLLAVRVPEEVANERRRKIRAYAKRKGKIPSKRQMYLANWTILVTNAPKELLELEEAFILARVRWQIELLFKLWKSHGKIDEWRTQNPWRILCELYAKLLAMLIQHWIFLIGCWQYINRSLRKGAKTIQAHALNLACAFASGSLERLVEVLETIQRCLAVGCRIYKRRKKPSTYQLLLAVNQISLT